VKYLIYAAIGLVLIIVQVLVSRIISIAGASPDFVLIFIVWLTVREGQFAGVVSGFALGLVLDIFSSGILGAHALSKTIACFLLGFFFDADMSEQRIRNWPFLVMTLGTAIVNNALYFFIYTRGSEISFGEFAFRYGALGALYTTVIAIIPLLYFMRKRAF
jgi:rod shape-determining protein MreD